MLATNPTSLSLTPPSAANELPNPIVVEDSCSGGESTLSNSCDGPLPVADDGDYGELANGYTLHKMAAVMVFIIDIPSPPPLLSPHSPALVKLS